MRIHLVASTLAALSLVAAGCGDSVQSIMEERDALYGRMNDVLEDVTDAESAQEARAELDELEQELAEIDARMERYGAENQEDAMKQLAAIEAEEFEQESRFHQLMGKLLSDGELARALHGTPDVGSQ